MYMDTFRIEFFQTIASSEFWTCFYTAATSFPGPKGSSLSMFKVLLKKKTVFLLTSIFIHLSIVNPETTENRKRLEYRNIGFDKWLS